MEAWRSQATFHPANWQSVKHEKAWPRSTFSYAVFLESNLIFSILTMFFKYLKCLCTRPNRFLSENLWPGKESKVWMKMYKYYIML